MKIRKMEPLFEFVSLDNILWQGYVRFTRWIVKSASSACSYGVTKVFRFLFAQLSLAQTFRLPQKGLNCSNLVFRGEIYEPFVPCLRGLGCLLIRHLGVQFCQMIYLVLTLTRRFTGSRRGSHTYVVTREGRGDFLSAKIALMSSNLRWRDLVQ